MKIGYIYAYGMESQEWKKNNPPIHEIINELKELGCEKIYMDVFIEGNGFKEIERIDMRQLLENIGGASGEDVFELHIRGRVVKELNSDGLESQFKKEIERIDNRWENNYENRLRSSLDT